MSDSLVLKGLKDVRKHTGDEMLLMRPKRGGDSYPVKKWWATNPAQTVYAGCSVFKVTAGANECFLAIDTAEMSTVRVDHDGSFGFTFFINKEVSRAALFTDGWEIIEHYVFPKISGGKVMTVIPPGAASKPGGAPPATVIGTVVVTGSNVAANGANQSYSAATGSATASPLAYSWAATGDASIASGGSTATASVDFTFSSGTSTVTCTVTSTDPGVTDSPSSDSLTVTVSA
jgi:hypothetical protein